MLSVKFGRESIIDSDVRVESSLPGAMHSQGGLRSSKVKKTGLKPAVDVARVFGQIRGYPTVVEGAVWEIVFHCVLVGLMDVESSSG